MAKAFASQGDMTEKTITFDEIGRDLWAFTAEGDPNSGVIIGDESVMIVEAQATPRLAHKVIEQVRKVTDKPISHVVLTHYHAVRVLGASAYGADQIIMGEAARGMVMERGQEDWDSEYGRFPRLFDAADSIPGLTWPTITFKNRMTDPINPYQAPDSAPSIQEDTTYKPTWKQILFSFDGRIKRSQWWAVVGTQMLIVIAIGHESDDAKH